MKQFNIGTDSIYHTCKTGHKNIGRRRSDCGFPLGMVISISGKIDERRYDFNAYDKPSYDAFTSLPESFTDFGLIDISFSIFFFLKLVW